LCDQCDAGYVGYTCRHLYQRVDEHKTTIVGRHAKKAHGEALDDLLARFEVLRKYIQVAGVSLERIYMHIDELFITKG
jgi:hypothetical protein